MSDIKTVYLGVCVCVFVFVCVKMHTPEADFPLHQMKLYDFNISNV